MVIEFASDAMKKRNGKKEITTRVFFGLIKLTKVLI
jgi:hypothetical protein